MKLKTLLLIVLSFLAGTSVFAAGKNHRIISPDGRLTAVYDSGRLSVLLDKDTLLLPSAIGIAVDGITPSTKVRTAKKRSVHTAAEAYFYRQGSIDVTCNELTLSLTDGLLLTIRSYNEGVAYRFSVPKGTVKGSVIVRNEQADYTFGSRKAWVAYSTNDKKPMAMAFQNIYNVENLSSLCEKPLGESNSQRLAFLPATVDCGKAKVTVLESDVRHYPCMYVTPGSGMLKASFAPYPKTMARYAWRGMTYVDDTQEYIAKQDIAAAKQPFTMPWRILAVTERDTDMPVNNLVYALAEPNSIGDTSWIKPGKVAWDWWNDWNLKGVDFKTGINFETYKYYIDFAAAHGLEYIILDEGWYVSKNGDIMNAIPEVRLPELIAYGKEKGVDIILWTVFNVLDEHLDEACRKYAAMGIKGFKVDFMDRSDQTAVEMVERIAGACAKHHLTLDLHGIYAPVGLNRTYPNILNYEGVFGMEEARWTTIEDHDMPLYDVTFPFIRGMAGQVDFTPGAMRNGTKSDWKAIYTKPISMGTRCHQAACYIIHDSPLTMLADSPTNYEADEKYTRFISSFPTTFDETRILQGKIGEYIVTARRKGNTWYIAGQTNWDARDIILAPLTSRSALGDALLAKNPTTVTLLTDGVNAEHDAEDYSLSSPSAVPATVHLAPGGGFVMVVKSL